MVTVGEVSTFQNVKDDKPQVVKVLEEASEVHGAWQVYHECADAYDGCEGCAFCNEMDCGLKAALVDECADVMTAVCNLLDAIGVHDMRKSLDACEQRNRDRGRYE